MKCKLIARVGLAAVLATLLTLAGGCRPAAQEAVDAKFDLKIEPSPPAVGDAAVTLTVQDSQGAPLEGAEVRLEGNMNHAGMKPSFADMREVEPGRYAGTLDFTMGGDWYILVTGKTANGKRLEHKVDVPGVQRP